jgi:hypothetical protein
MNRILLAAPVAVLVTLCVGGLAAPTAAAAPSLDTRIATATPAAGPADDAAFCVALLSAAQSFQQVGQPTSLQSIPPSVIDGWAQIATIAPPEIKPDAEVVVDRLRRIQGGGPDQLTALRDLSPALRRVVTYTTEHCPNLAATR